MKLRLLSSTALAVLLLAPALLAADAPKAGSYIFVLDCSQSMDEPATTEAALTKQVSNVQPPTRMEAAQLMMRKMLRELAMGGKSDVGLWFYGHRIVWEPDAKQPELLPQDEYLEATVGYGALAELLPGDDVEQAQPLKRFDANDFETFRVRLDLVKPWGEKPLYLTLVKAIDALTDHQAPGPKAIIVFTDGGNEQWLAKHKTSRDLVAKQLAKNIVPVHFVHFGPRPAEQDATENELREIAEQGGGSLMHASATTEVTIGQVLSIGRKVPAVQTAEVEEAADTAAVPETPAARIAAAKALLATKPADRVISGSVVYYGKPVSSATVTLEGTSIPSVKTDRQGQFLIRKVPAGRTYRVMVKGIAKNSFREKAVELEVEADGEEQPFLTIDIGAR